MDGLSGKESALVARKGSDHRWIAQIQERRKCPERSIAIDIHLLFDGKHVNGWEISFGCFCWVDKCESGVGCTEIDTDVHAALRSRTLNSSFQRRPSAATHHSSSNPVSVTLLSSVTGTISSRALSVCGGRKTSIGDSSSMSSPSSSTIDPGKSSRRVADEKNRNSAGSPTTRAKRRCGSSTFEPSSKPKGTTVSALMGTGKPGTVGSELSMPT